MTTTVGIVMNGITGRMGYRQHLLRSVLAIRDQGGVELAGGRRIQVEPVLVGRDADRVRRIADAHSLTRWTTDLDAALSDPGNSVYFDAQVTAAREAAVMKAIRAGKHVYAEKPLAEDSSAAGRLAAAAHEAGVRTGVVHDKLFLPGLLKLRRLIELGFFGRILSVRGEFGYWVFEGDRQPAQRPSWNYRTESGGGITVDMFAHWNYLLENLFGRVEAVTARAVTHIPRRWDEQGQAYAATADDAVYALFEVAGGVVVALNSSWAVRVHRDELFELQVDGVEGSAVAGLHRCVVQHRGTTPRPVWNPDESDGVDYRGQWQAVPDNTRFDNGFKAQWEGFLRHVVEGGPYAYDFDAGGRGIRLAEAGLASSASGRRIEIEPGPRLEVAGRPAPLVTDRS